MRPRFGLIYYEPKFQVLAIRTRALASVALVRYCSDDLKHPETKLGLRFIASGNYSFYVIFIPKGFFKFATTLVDLLFNDLMLHLSLVKQMYSHTIHLTNELKNQ